MHEFWTIPIAKMTHTRSQNYTNITYARSRNYTNMMVGEHGIHDIDGVLFGKSEMIF